MNRNTNYTVSRYIYSKSPSIRPDERSFRGVLEFVELLVLGTMVYIASRASLSGFIIAIIISLILGSSGVAVIATPWLFALLYSLGSVGIIASTILLTGIWNQIETWKTILKRPIQLIGALAFNLLLITNLSLGCTLRIIALSSILWVV